MSGLNLPSTADDNSKIERYKVLRHNWINVRESWWGAYDGREVWQVPDWPPRSSLPLGPMDLPDTHFKVITYNLHKMMGSEGGFVRVSAEGWWITDEDLDWRFRIRGRDDEGWKEEEDDDDGA